MQPGRSGRAGTEPAIPAVWLLGLRVLQPALWALRFGFLLSALFLFLARPRGCRPTSKGKVGCEGQRRGRAGVNTGLGPARQWVMEVKSCRDVSPAALGTAVVRLLKEGRLFSCSSASRSWCPSNL